MTDRVVIGESYGYGYIVDQRREATVRVLAHKIVSAQGFVDKVLEPVRTARLNHLVTVVADPSFKFMVPDDAVFDAWPDRLQGRELAEIIGEETAHHD